MVFALVTIYKPDERVMDNIKRICFQTDCVFVLDNSPYMNNFYNDIDKVRYIYNGKNLGLSKAFNNILKDVTNFNDDDFIIFFDQDSTISTGHIESLISIYKNYEIQLNIGALGPVIFDRNTEKDSMGKNFKNELDKKVSIVPRLITSSLICRYKNLRMIDFWDENIFLDWTDFDLSYRLQTQQLKCGIANTVKLNHCLGDNNKKFLGKEFPYYSPLREYYQIRDSLRLVNKKSTPFKEKIGMLYVALFRTLIHLVVFDKKRKEYVFIGKHILIL